jgi:serine/threonine-protein kinase RsbT
VTARAAEIRVPVHEECDVAVARARARALARAEGFPSNRSEALATAISEIARNIVVHAGAGEIVLATVTHRGRRGIRVVARDDHPGIADVERAMRDGYSTKNGLGLGLPGARRLVDEFTLESSPGRGTTVTMTKWLHAVDR